MRFTQQTQNAATNLIRGYAAGELRINDQVYRNAVILTAGTVLEPAALCGVADLNDAVIEQTLALAPDVVLLGTGTQQIFPPPAFGARFLRAGVGFEVMDTGAACRTYNVLVSELRNVAGIILL